MILSIDIINLYLWWRSLMYCSSFLLAAYPEFIWAALQFCWPHWSQQVCRLVADMRMHRVTLFPMCADHGSDTSCVVHSRNNPIDHTKIWWENEWKCMGWEILAFLITWDSWDWPKRECNIDATTPRWGVDEGMFQKEMGGGGSGKLDLHSETPFILMRSNEGNDAMTNSDVSLLRIV